VNLFDYASLWRCLAELGLANWQETLEPVLRARLSDDGHGDFERWRAALDRLRAEPGSNQSRRDQLLSLSPWRKGPFELDGITIDSEWRSNLKWDRLKNAIEPLAGRAVLDVGCGNGYYAVQMSDAGARAVVGVDPTILYVMQFLAVAHFLRPGSVFALPLRLDELPRNSRKFDTAFSMGVLYHQRSPIDHLLQLKSMLRQGGQLVLETIYVPDEKSWASTPPGRYARMRNVWLLPTVAELATWLSRTGFVDINVVDKSRTTTFEQRSTEWMSFESLREALKPDDPELTVEGLPAPRRVIVVANAP
jgi:tRNA (mo5U34)-methyltransferase